LAVRSILITLAVCLSVCGAFAQPSSTASNMQPSNVMRYGARADGVADDSIAIQKALDDISSQEVYLPNGSYKLDRGLIVKRSNLKLVLAPSAVLIKNSNFEMLQILADGVTVEGGVFDGRREEGFASSGISARRCRGLSILKTTVKNQAGFGIYVSNVTNFHLTSNALLNNGSGIFGEYDSSSGTIENNSIDTTNGGPHSTDIAFHSTYPGAQVRDLTITGNQLTNGAMFCIEVGAFGGLRPTGIHVGPGNTCEISSDARPYSSGISLDSVDDSKVIQNTFDSMEHPAGVAIELVNASRIQVWQNVVKGHGTMRGGVAVTGAHDCQLSENTISDFLHVGIGLYGANDRPSASNNTIEDNIFQFARAQQVVGIRMTANGESKLDGNTIRGNRFESVTGSGSIAVQMRRLSTASLDGTVMTQNTLRGVDAGLDDRASTNTRFTDNDSKPFRP
jgi:parallel beta-helix repeat protein